MIEKVIEEAIKNDVLIGFDPSYHKMILGEVHDGIEYIKSLISKIDKNNVKNVTLTEEGREINRHNFTLEEINKAYNKTVVQRLLKLIDFRNDYPAFDGDLIVEDSDNNKIILTWKKDDKYCTLNVDLNTN